MGERGVLQVGEDLLDNGVFAVHGFGLDEDERAAGEDDVVAPEAEQLGLPGGHAPCIQPLHAAHDQPGGGVEPLLLAGERGERDFVDLGVGDPAFLLGVPDSGGVLDRRPGVLGDAGDRVADRLRDRDRQRGGGGRAADRHGLVGEERRVRADDEVARTLTLA
ncbi:hypothetical protein [Streptomyces sp. JNUCC 63]